jgi:S-formylglutathione hydrolase
MQTVTTRLRQESLDSDAVGASVEFRILEPASYVAGERLPLILHLHGAMSSSASLEAARPLYDELMARSELPRAIVACPSTPTLGGFYIDRPGAEWETAVARELPDRLAELYGPPMGIGLIGASMGGYGALKIAFADPERFASVAALSPAVFPGETPEVVPSENLQSVLGDLHLAMSEGTGSSERYATNSVYGRARRNAVRIRHSGLAILVDCGAADEFRLHEGAEFLHELLDKLEIPHRYNLVADAGHVGPSSAIRTAEAIRFVGATLVKRLDDD